MVKLKLPYLALSLVILSLTGSLIAACNHDEKAQEVTFEQLFADPTEYSGKFITIEGVYFHGFEIIVLSEDLAFSEFAYGHLVPEGRMIWIEGGIPEYIYKELYKQDMIGPEEHFGKVRVSGTFEYGKEYGHLGSYNSQITPSEVAIIPWSRPAKQ
ncbi:hypothetical protein ACFLUQ_00395 [Chloroflexota bacterium]